MTRYAEDIETICAHRHDNGADFWATTDGRIYVGNPFSTIGSLNMLHELEVERDHPLVEGGLALIQEACRPDGRIRVAPTAPLYPCYTAEAVRVLARYGMSHHEAVARTRAYFLENDYETGGWRCTFTRFGRGPETLHASPGATLYVLDLLRFFPADREGNETVEKAIDVLLEHWVSRKPIGPCHHGIGSRFMRVEYPFVRYNLFYSVYVLSFFSRARRDERFRAALAALQSRLTAEGEMVVESPHRGLKGLHFCARGQPSAAATRRYREIVRNTGD